MWVSSQEFWSWSYSCVLVSCGVLLGCGGGSTICSPAAPPIDIFQMAEGIIGRANGIVLSSGTCGQKSLSQTTTCRSAEYAVHITANGTDGAQYDNLVDDLWKEVRANIKQRG
jgi:hypothetical protein